MSELNEKFLITFDLARQYPEEDVSMLYGRLSVFILEVGHSVMTVQSKRPKDHEKVHCMKCKRLLRQCHYYVHGDEISSRCIPCDNQARAVLAVQAAGRKLEKYLKNKYRRPAYETTGETFGD